MFPDLPVGNSDQFMGDWEMTSAFFLGHLRKPGHQNSGLDPHIYYHGPQSKKNLLSWPGPVLRNAMFLQLQAKLPSSGSWQYSNTVDYTTPSDRN
jgi:hypothetical protein